MDVDYTNLGRLLASSARSQIVSVLSDGAERSASELARHAGVAPSTASEHLRALVDGGLLACEARGRQRSFRIASVEIAEALESLSGICPRRVGQSLQASSEARALHRARTCYDHLAGVLGVEMLAALLSRGWLATAGDSCVLGPRAQGFASLAIDLAALARARRPMIRLCPDWTVGEPHLGGGLGAAICASLVAASWVTPAERRRGLVVTAAGRRGLSGLLGLDVLTPARE